MYNATRPSRSRLGRLEALLPLPNFSLSHNLRESVVATTGSISLAGLCLLIRPRIGFHNRPEILQVVLG